MNPLPAELTLPAIFAETLSKYPKRPAMAMVGLPAVSYEELHSRVHSVMALLENLDIQAGDKVAILSTNLVNWGVSYYAIALMGAVVVPLLPDFHPDEIANILLHSEAKAVFVSEGLMPKIAGESWVDTLVKIKIEDFSIIGIPKKPHSPIRPSVPQNQYIVKPDDLLAIIYTSGTTGKSKGVMLTHRNICFDALMSGRVQEILPTDRFLSILPLSHTYENTLGLILPMMSGACVYYTGKTPTPSVLLPALKMVRPTIMLSVPLIIEKIYNNQIKPALSKNAGMRMAMRIPVLRLQLTRLAGRKLVKTFGGELKFFGIGGAKLNRHVEKFLIDARFPYAIGYGLTESSPMLAGCNPQHTRLQSTGKPIDGIELKLNNPNQVTGEGEIWAKGPNIMQGYYKEPQLTSEILTPDGWLKTGDLGVFDQDGNLYIKERIKNIIVRSGGENVYPEEIESVINTFEHVTESLVVERNGKLTALVNFNVEEIKNHYHRHIHLFQHLEIGDYIRHEINRLISELKDFIKHRLNKFSQIQDVVHHPEPFEKTATLKIKRYLYSKTKTNHPS